MIFGLGKSALSQGSIPATEDGAPDTSLIEHEHLDDLIAKGTLLSDSTVEAKKYQSTMIMIKQFRDTLKKQNWSGLQNLLAQSFFTGTIPIEVVGEVAEAKRILRNVIAIDNLKSSLQRGMAKTSSVTKIFDPKGIELSHVEAQINQGYGNYTRGSFCRIEAAHSVFTICMRNEAKFNGGFLGHRRSFTGTHCPSRKCRGY